MDYEERSRREWEILECWADFDRRLEAFRQSLDGVSPGFKKLFAEGEALMLARRQAANEAYLAAIDVIENNRAQARPDTVDVWERNALAKYRFSAQLHQLFLKTLIEQRLKDESRGNKE